MPKSKRGGRIPPRNVKTPRGKSAAPEIPPPEERLNYQLWRLRQRVNLIGWCLVGAVGLLVAIEAWRALG